VDKYLQNMGLNWKEADVVAVNRHEWRHSGAQCVISSLKTLIGILLLNTMNNNI